MRPTGVSKIAGFAIAAVAAACWIASASSPQSKVDDKGGSRNLLPEESSIVNPVSMSHIGHGVMQRPTVGSPTPSSYFVGADDGRAFVWDEDTDTIHYIPTSMTVFKAFGISGQHNALLYSPLKNGIPSGELFLENLVNGTATKITDDLVLHAELSPDETNIAYSVATAQGFGLVVVNSDSGEVQKVTSNSVAPDFIKWDAAGRAVYFFKTHFEANTSRVVPYGLDIQHKELSIAPPDVLPNGFPRPSTELGIGARSARNVPEESQWEIAYPFELFSPDGTHKVCGSDFFGNEGIFVCGDTRSPGTSQTSQLATGQVTAVLNSGIIFRSFKQNRTVTTFVTWGGKYTNLAVSTATSYNLPFSSFTLTQGGASYPSPGNCNISSHTGNLSFAYDMQNGTAGKHVLSSSDGLVVSAVNTVTCNSLSTSCADYSYSCSNNGGWGNTVIIQHADGTYTRYAHLQFNSVQVSLNASVCQGLYIGNQGHTGNTCCVSFNGCGDHLHFQRQSTVSGASISMTFSDVASNPLSCGTTYSSGSVEISSCCSNGSSTLRNRDGGPPIHPPGSLLKTSSSSTVYLIDPDNRKRPITSSSVLAQLYNQSTDSRTSTNFSNWVITVGQDELDLYEQGGNISAAQPGNGKPFPDGKLIGYNGEVSIVTGIGKRRPFTDASRFTGLGYNFCQVVNVSQTEYNSYPVGPPVDAMPLLTGSVNLSPSGPYTVGQSITGSFTIKNVGYQSLPFSSLGIGGRLNGSSVYDMSFVATTLAAGSSYSYNSQSRQLTSSGTYDFFAAYQENNGHWAISVPAAPGVVRSRQITVGTGSAPSAPSANSATSVTNSSFTSNWNSSTGATGYRLDVAINSSFSSFVSGYNNLDVGNVLSRSVTGLNSNTTYYYRVRAYNSAGTSGNSNTISVTTSGSSAPANNNFANAQIISGSLGTVFGTNVGANKESGEPNHAGITGGASVWYRWTAPATSTVSFATSGSSFDTLLAAYTGSSVSGLTPVASNDDFGGSLQSAITFNAQNGVTYYIAVDGFGGATGSIVLGWGQVPPAPTATAATNVTTSSFTANWNTSTGAAGYRLDASINSSFSSYVSGFQNLDVGNVTSRSVTGLSSNTTYYYRVRAENAAGTSGNSNVISVTTASPTVTRTLTVASSNPSSGVSITVSPNDNNGSGNGTTQFTRTYNNNTNLSLTAPSTAGGNNFQKWQLDGVDLTTSPLANFVMDANHTMTAVYTTPVVTRTLTVASSNPASGVSITVSPSDNNGQNNGTTQFTRTYNNNTNVNLTAPATASGNNFQKWQRNGSDWSFNQTTSVTMDANHTMTAVYVTGTSTPPNNNFANAQIISGTSGTVNGTNVGANKESGEPNHAGNSGGASVWYRWQAPTTGAVTFTTTSSNFDTLLAAYTGQSVSSLTLIAANDDFNGTLQSGIGFTAQSGVTYHVAVDGFGGATGSVLLTWNMVTSTAPVIFIEQGTTNRVAALDSVTWLRGPFRVLNFFNFSPDSHTRVIFFTSDLGLTQADSTQLTVRAAGISLPVESVGPYLPLGGVNTSFIVVRLPDGLPPGDLPLVVTLRGVSSSNSPTLAISQ
jgi:hypothetical protein